MFGGKTLVAHKERDFNTGHIKSLDLIGGYNESGNKAIIVDDLCSKGGTFILTANALRERGFKEIYLVVAHAEDAIFKGDVFAANSPITKVFCTDSIISNDWLVWTNAQHKDKIDITPLQELVVSE
jgi:ribose-phosphate pyrophosphokinase